MRRNSIWRRRRLVGYAFIAPVFAFLCAVVLFPLAHAFWTSLMRIRGLNATFVGMQNYERVLGDDAFWHSLAVSLHSRPHASRCTSRSDSRSRFC